MCFDSLPKTNKSKNVEENNFNNGMCEKKCEGKVITGCQKKKKKNL